MCYVCCKELKGWCKSFTRTEALLSVLEAVLLVLLIGFLVFLILHFMACRTCLESAPETCFENEQKITTQPALTTNITLVAVTLTEHSTLPPDVECTWEPSQQTTARTRYYLSDDSAAGDEDAGYTSTILSFDKDQFTTTESPEVFGETRELPHEYDDFEIIKQSDGELAEERYKSQVAALVKLKPPGDVTFGCILTKITKFWTLTAASCIESIEEVDSLDSFIIIEDFGEAGASRPRTVRDVRVHPRDQAAPPHAHDLAALRTDRALRVRAPLLRLPRALDVLLVALGERFLILGYGGYRTVDSRSDARRLRQVAVFVSRGAACAAPAGQWAARHLSRGSAARQGACGAAPLCAGSLAGRGSPCNYCSGAPLLRGNTLFGVMSDNSACGVACEPQLYVNLATLRDWIDSVIE